MEQNLEPGGKRAARQVATWIIAYVLAIGWMALPLYTCLWLQSQT